MARKLPRRGRTAPPPLAALALVALAAVALARPARAHELWLHPSDFRPAPGARLAVRVLVARSDGPGADPVAPRPGWIERFVLAGPGGTAPVRSVPGVDPAGFARLGPAGVYAVGLVTGGTPNTLSAERFERYLDHEGLSAVIRARRERGEEGAPGRELFTRSVKSLVVAGAAPGHAGYDRVLGLPFELVARSDPFAAAGALYLEVLVGGRPAADVQVAARPESAGDDAEVTAVSGPDGRVRLPLAAPETGPEIWVVSAVRMEAAPPGSGADWHSTWTSLTFERPAP